MFLEKVDSTQVHPSKMESTGHSPLTLKAGELFQGSYGPAVKAKNQCVNLNYKLKSHSFPHIHKVFAF